MNTRIYYLDKYLEFTGQIVQNSLKEHAVFRAGAPGAPSLKTVAESFNDPGNPQCIHLVGYDEAATIEALKKHYHYIEAAGGLIGRDGRWLFIRRHNRWDLPKGKLEKNERPEQGAVRECEEECAVKGLRIVGKLSPTYHVYAHKGGFALKRTHWYRMLTDYSGPLKPQADEDITEVKWFGESEIRSKVMTDTYYTIADVVREGLSSGR